ncbi:alanine racemase [Lichenifustis flavocetrariae]|uniref:Alanine racemase n=1 Tax=Lichenifustis flavocetrariae TaxID=2949735 RepID=A0AA42CKV1_9HYPH|nr:alanine racemase [Lichenifustis flavocetrariae]MCW6510938.1 alanine racemase [Lichenifustis flavocetrariae]
MRIMTLPGSDFLDDTVRGVPPGTSGLPLAAVGHQKWHPAEGVMSLPVLTMDEAGFRHNAAAMMRYVTQHGVAIAPHAKTPMAPTLAAQLLEAGAWGTTVADPRQAAVMLRAGLTRLILANEVGGLGGARRLAALCRNYPEAEIYAFADSTAAVGALAQTWTEVDLPPLRVLVEVGAARAGARDLTTAKDLLEAVAAASHLSLAGIATYEGAAAQPTPERSLTVIDALLDLAAELFVHARALKRSDEALIVTAGGSVFFDRVVARLGTVVAADGAATLVLRSGAMFFGDHGIYERAFATIDGREGFRLDDAPASMAATFQPVLRLWAEVLSRPEADQAICGMGMRDVSFDQDLPRPLRVFRNGVALPTPNSLFATTKLNDQHAFLSVPPGSDLQVGDVLEFGISHPCTCLHLYRVLFGTDPAGRVLRAHPTFFG